MQIFVGFFTILFCLRFWFRTFVVMMTALMLEFVTRTFRLAFKTRTILLWTIVLAATGSWTEWFIETQYFLHLTCTQILAELVIVFGLQVS